MSNSDGTCEYVLDPRDPETWGGEKGDVCYIDEELLNEDGVWSCPHDANGESELCIFHTPVSEKQDEKVVTAFLEVLNDVSNSGNLNEPVQKLQFLGAKFGKFDLSERLDAIDIEVGGLAMHCIQITELLDWSGVKINVPKVELRSIRCRGSVNFVDTVFCGEIYFDDAEFVSGVSFTKAKFKNKVSFHSASFEQHAEFELTEFNSLSDFNLVVFSKRASFEKAKFRARSDFYGCKFSGTAMFRQSNFGDYVSFGSVEFREDGRFEEVTFEDESFFRHSEFWDTALFNDAEFEGIADFRSVEFTEDADFSELNLDSSQFNNADLTDASFAGTKLRDTDFESALMSRATLFGADFRGSRLNGAVLGDIRIDDQTIFLGHPSDNSDPSPHTISAIRSQPRCVYDPTYEEDNEHENRDKAKSVYRALEELGSKHARSRLQARSFVRRQDIKKQGYLDDATATNVSFEKRIIAGARWLRAEVARTTLLYGESPWRVIATSLIAITDSDFCIQ